MLLFVVFANCIQVVAEYFSVLIPMPTHFFNYRICHCCLPIFLQGNKSQSKRRKVRKRLKYCPIFHILPKSDYTLKNDQNQADSQQKSHFPQIDAISNGKLEPRKINHQDTHRHSSGQAKTLGFTMGKMRPYGA